MNQLSTELKSHVIVFIDRSYKYIPQDKATALFNLSVTPATSFELNGNYYDFKGVSKILTYADFCAEYPDKIRKEQENARPQYNLGVHEAGESHKQYMKKGNAIRLMIKGIERYVEETGSTGQAKELLDRMEKRLSAIEQETPC